MKLECPSCHQKYRLTNQTVPAGKTAVTCRVCTHSIPLEQRAAQPKPESGGKKISVSCGYCGQTAGIDPAAAAGADKIQCPACKHPIVLTPGRAIAAVPEKPDRQSVHLKCGQCSQTYTLSRSKIPANAASATCRSCGNKIPIPRSLRQHHHSGASEERARPSAGQPDATAAATMVEEVAGVATAKKSLPRVTLALLLVALIGFGIWFGGSWLLDQFKTGWDVLIASTPGTVKRTPEGTFKSRPFATVRLNPALVIHAIKNRLPENSIHQKSLAVVGTLGFKRMELFLLPQSEWLAVPALILQGRGVGHLETLLAGYNLVEDGISKTGKGQYLIDPSNLGKGDDREYATVSYVAWFRDDTLLLAPEVLMGKPQSVFDRLNESAVSQFAGELTSSRFAGAFAIEIEDAFDGGWQGKVSQNPALELDSRVVTVAGMGTSVISHLDELLEALDMLGAQLTVTGEERTRTFSYHQRFQSRSQAERFYAYVQSGDPRDPSMPWLARQMVTLFKDRRIKYVCTLNKKQLDVQVQWLPDEDYVINSALLGAMRGQRIAPVTVASTNMEPSAGTVETIISRAPQFSLSADRAELERVIPSAFQACIFPGTYFEGEAPYMNLELDTVLFPNASLADAAYKVVGVTSQKGADILRQPGEDAQQALKPGTLSPGVIAVAVKPHTPAEALASAVVRFDLTIPTSLAQAEFLATDPAGTVRQAGDLAVTLKRIEKDVAAISFPKNPGIHLFAFDAEGRPLAASEAKMADTSAAVRFYGIIARLLVLATVEEMQMPFELALDLNRGQELKLAHQPEKPARVRYDHRPVRDFANYREADLTGLRVSWDEGRDPSWFDSLMVVLPHGPFHGQTDWEAHFFGQQEPVHLSGSPTNTGQQIRFDLEKGALTNAHAVYGRVALRLSTDIQRLPLVKEADKAPVVHKLSSGKIVKVIFDQNEVLITPYDQSMVQIVAYDTQGRRLKQDAFSQGRGSLHKLYFWGIPARIDIDVAEGQVRKTVDFDIVQRQLDRSAYENFKRQLNDQREVVSTLRQIAAARDKDRNRYGDDLAGLYYLYDFKKKEPMRLIDAAVAHSDPAGAARFGYDLSPCKGYYFTVLAGIASGGSQTEFPRENKSHSVTWEKGTIEAGRYKKLPTIAAIPADKSKPTFFVEEGQVFMKSMAGETLKYYPADHISQGWVEARVVEG